jgi:lysophospholipid hydrolase
MSWLAEQEETHSLVLYVADGGVNSPWTQRCVRQADCILLVGIADDDPVIGEFERLLIGMKTTARKELVLLHSERFCTPGVTSAWLKNRLWIHAHHHVEMKTKTNSKIISHAERKGTFTNLQTQLLQYYHTRATSLIPKSSPVIYTGVRSDFARLARRLLSKSVGLVLGGGGMYISIEVLGARGISHIGLICALEEAGIPIDMVGGTSIGSLVGGLYARENDHLSVYGRAKMFSAVMTSKWRQILDLTYPVTSMFTGHAFNRAIWKCFLDTQIEDCWLSYFAVTTNITWSRMEIHKAGYMWRYVRASMSLSGYLPPLCDRGDMLLDGGYINNLPADIMRSLGASTIIAVDVGRVDSTSPVNYGDTLSGWWVLLNRLNPFGHKYGTIPQMAEIQSRLAYVSSVKQLEDAKKIEGCYYVHPDVNRFETLQFDKFNEIYTEGYKSGKELIQRWRDEGVLESRFNVYLHEDAKDKGRRGRRASI